MIGFIVGVVFIVLLAGAVSRGVLSAGSAFCVFLSALFGFLTYIFLQASENKLDMQTSKVLGIDSVINLQGTIFAAASAIICVMCLIGAIVVQAISKSRE